MYQECVRTYGDINFKGVLPHGYVFPKVLKVCALLSNLKVGIVVHRDVIILHLLICIHYSKCEDVRSAKQVFDEMVGRDLLSHNSMISGYVCNGLFGLALGLFDSMLDGCEPDIVTLNTIMDAYC
ncbi:hypothetical protein DVH24_030044 [Malus domestica]|uniref:Pentatricopeptide repeat-containing protein n=1 Tax=Malus domestica TaxID=3750 RepID=A0A498I2L6_MALDO|nr:hypothetical protein DVH24_030044 [Malus domestica]